MQRLNRLSKCLLVLALCAGCSDATSPDRESPPLPDAEIDRLLVFVRNTPEGDHVEIDFQRQAGGSTLLVYEPLFVVTIFYLILTAIIARCFGLIEAQVPVRR